MIYIEKYWLKKYKDLYSYGELIKDIINLKIIILIMKVLFNRKII